MQYGRGVSELVNNIQNFLFMAFCFVLILISLLLRILASWLHKVANEAGQTQVSILAV